MEWSPNGVFEDRASQAFWFREQPVPDFVVHKNDHQLVVETEFLRLKYQIDKPFSPESLAVDLKETGLAWNFGDNDPENLGGTARTVDEVDGATSLGIGLVSRAGWSVVDDSTSLVFNELGWLEPREAPAGQRDFYFFGYGHDYLGCLREFSLVSGPVPMIPRFVLGNWWSRYWQYSQEELTGLMDAFQAHETPLSVCIIDMDWHITKTGNDSTGWTGYTWNRTLFPDPEGALKFLHEKGLKVALNLHPAEGIHRHEEMYPAMAEAVGMDPATGDPVEFDITNPRFVEAYFRLLHHPQEERGIDFWWMDWQQGARTRLSGLDPLWWLNHLHFMDLGRDGKRRSFIFSRWGGLGNHRYPIGFSGDSIVSWASLAFQPYFTSTSSNVNYGWWSHDIGGHMGGYEEAELYARWVQMGAFQPVLRLHSTNNPFHDRTPWGYDAETFEAARGAMQLRHALVPYLYSMAWRYHRENIPPIVPMYYEYPEQDEAYACPNQYKFGSQLIVAPFITPKDPDTQLSRAVAWLPEGDWYNIFDGTYNEGNGWQAIYGTLRDIPVFAKAGAIVPMAPLSAKNCVGTPDHLQIVVFPGAGGAFDVYEDEGNSMAYLNGEYAITHIRHEWESDLSKLTISPAEGSREILPQNRRIDLIFRGFNAPDGVTVLKNSAPVEARIYYDKGTRTLTVEGISISPSDELEAVLTARDGELANRDDTRPGTIMKMLKHFYLETNAKANIALDIEKIITSPANLGKYGSLLAASQTRALMETITGAGIEFSESTGDPLIVVWNNHCDENVMEYYSMTRLLHWFRYMTPYEWANEAAPKFQAFKPAEDFQAGNPWLVQINYYGLGTVKFQG